MARPTTEIKAQMVAKKEATEELSALTSDSRTSTWGLLFYVIAYVLNLQEQQWDAYRIETEDFAERQRIHNFGWYRDRALEFQEGKQLVWKDGTFKYPELLDGDDLDTLQIVKQAAVTSSPNKLLVKVATEVNGVLQPISAVQELRVLSYMRSIRGAGNNIEIENFNPDELRLEGVIYCDPLLISSDGSLVSDSSIFPVEDAIQAYINEENFENFDGEIRRTFLKDRVQMVTGVIDMKIDSMQARHGTLPFEEVEVSHLPRSGYYTISSMNLQYVYE